MALERLSARQVQTAPPGARPILKADGGGLYLRIAPTGAKSWIFRYRAGARQHDLGLGPFPDVGLSEARERASAQRRLRRDGKDPMQQRRAQRDAAALERANAMSLRECTDLYVAAHRAAWKGSANEAQWRASLATYAFPLIGDLPVTAIDTGAVMRVIEPLWREKPETASRVRRRIEALLDYAGARGWRQGDNPAKWRGHIEHMLPSRTEAKPVEHFAALPYAEVSGFMAAVRERDGVAANGLQFLILTATRANEVLGATWAEIDLVNRVWIIPAARMKSGREHRVPLSDAAIALLGKPGTPDTFVFPCGKTGGKPYRHLFFNELRRLGRGDLTVHGFRSSFRDWAAERTSYPAEVAEMALAHAVGTAVERSYRRTDLFDRRRRLMADWAKFCATPVASDETRVMKLRS